MTIFGKLKMLRETLLLASRSPARARLLSAAGVSFKVAVPKVDEAVIKARMYTNQASPAQAANALAEAKALQLSRKEPKVLVLGADQLLVCDHLWFDKPGDQNSLREQILTLQGRWHTLWTAAVMMRNGERVWHTQQEARLRMRPLTEAEIQRYVAAAAPRAVSCVGGYEIEGIGVNLFTEVKGDMFVIQGLPLLEVLQALRELARESL